MERSNSFGTSWADQWDYSNNPDPIRPETRDIGHGKKSGVEKTKEVAATGLKKVKAGTSMGFNWIKDKCQQKKTQKH